MLDHLLIALYSFGRNSIGLVVRPYETYRTIVEKSSVWELFPVGIVLSVYFATASLVKTAAFRPYLLTKQFILLAGAAGISYVFVVGVLFIASLIMKGHGLFRSFIIGWAYTLIPTVAWFLMTSLLFVLLPPPRTTQITGIAFSICYVIISSVLLFWKIILSYLTLRFGMRLDLFRIIGVALLAGPVIGLYCVGLYKLGIFKVPFI